MLSTVVKTAMIKLPRQQTLPPVAAAYVENHVAIAGVERTSTFSTQLNKFVSPKEAEQINSLNEYVRLLQQL